MAEDNHVKSIIQVFSSGRMYESWSRQWDRGLSQDESILIRIYCHDLNAEICNLGCGAGRETLALYNMGYHNVRGIDATSELLEAARKHSKDKRLGIEFELATADNLPYESNIFDVVTMFENVYGHITPRSSRVRSLSEVRRVLKLRGRVLMTATSLYDNWLPFSFIKILEVLRIFYNPCGMEKGDKKLSRSSTKGIVGKKTARSHWFRPDEIPEDAQKVGLSVIQATTVAGLCKEPKQNSTKCHKQGRLVYVLEKPM